MNGLQGLVRFITTHLNPANLLRAVPSDALLEKWSSDISLLCDEADITLMHTVYYKDYPLSFSCLIAQYQCLLTQGMDVLYADRFRNDRDPTVALRTETLQRMDGLYQALLDFYQPYFNQEARLPAWRRDQACRQLRRRKAQVCKLLCQKKVNDQLCDIVLLSFDLFYRRKAAATVFYIIYIHSTRPYYRLLAIRRRISKRTYAAYCLFITITCRRLFPIISRY